MGAALPYNFLLFAITYDMPTDEEVHRMVRGLQNRQAIGATRLRDEHHKGWFHELQHQEKAARENPGKEGADLGLSCKWQIFLESIQIIWDCGEILEQMSWIVVVLLPKGRSDFQGIGLLDPCWKVVEKIMVC
jgi:hypothetical protein